MAQMFDPSNSGNSESSSTALVFINDRFTAEEHAKWDQQLVKFVSMDGSPLEMPGLLLSNIVGNCACLNNIYAIMPNCDELIKRFPEILEELRKAVNKKSFKCVRLLGML